MCWWERKLPPWEEEGEAEHILALFVPWREAVRGSELLCWLWDHLESPPYVPSKPTAGLVLVTERCSCAEHREREPHSGRSGYVHTATHYRESEERKPPGQRASKSFSFSLKMQSLALSSLAA